jgi:hypothetical protein
METVSGDVDSLFHMFQPLVAIEIIQNCLWLCMNTENVSGGKWAVHW